MSTRTGPNRPVLAGNSAAAIYVLELLLDEWAPSELLVIAAPDDESADWHPSLADAARRYDVPTWQPDRVNAPEAIEALRAHDCDLLLSVYYTQIFRPELLSVIHGPAVNFHPSLLPRHRGTAPIIWAIAEGDTVTGVSVHELTVGIDTGPLVDQATLPIHPDDTGFSVHEKAALLVRALAARLLRRLLAGEGLPERTEQSGIATYHSKKDPRLNHLDWTSSRERVRNIVRALAPPLPGADTMLGDRRIVIEQADLCEVGAHIRAPGMVQIRRPGAEVLIWAGDGPLQIKRISCDGESLTGPALLDVLSRAEGEVAR